MTSGNRLKTMSKTTTSPRPGGGRQIALLLALAGSIAAATGCQTFGRPQNQTKTQVMLDAQCPPTDPANMPAKELAKVTLPPYVIEAPDILLVDALRVVPKPPFRIQSFDVLQVIVEGTLLEQPINGLYVVEPGGMLDLGPSYGKVMVGGQSLEEAQDSVFRHLKRTLRDPQVSLLEANASRSAGVAHTCPGGRPAADCWRAPCGPRRYDQSWDLWQRVCDGPHA